MTKCKYGVCDFALSLAQNLNNSWFGLTMHMFSGLLHIFLLQRNYIQRRIEYARLLVASPIQSKKMFSFTM